VYCVYSYSVRVCLHIVNVHMGFSPLLSRISSILTWYTEPGFRTRIRVTSLAICCYRRRFLPSAAGFSCRIFFLSHRHGSLLPRRLNSSAVATSFLATLAVPLTPVPAALSARAGDPTHPRWRAGPACPCARRSPRELARACASSVRCSRSLSAAPLLCAAPLHSPTLACLRALFLGACTGAAAPPLHPHAVLCAFSVSDFYIGLSLGIKKTKRKKLRDGISSGSSLWWCSNPTISSDFQWHQLS
jgi:hypothetical protein